MSKKTKDDIPQGFGVEIVPDLQEKEDKVEDANN